MSGDNLIFENLKKMIICHFDEHWVGNSYLAWYILYVNTESAYQKKKTYILV